MHIVVFRKHQKINTLLKFSISIFTELLKGLENSVKQKIPTLVRIFNQF